MYFSDTSVDLKYNNKDVHVSLIPNPSHLEVRNASFISPYPNELQALSSLPSLGTCMYCKLKLESSVSLGYCRKKDTILMTYVNHIGF